jgi:PKD repeat protein
MKKILTIIVFALLSANVFSQSLCQAYFTSSVDPSGSTLNLYDQSYNIDSTQINATSWTWTLQYGGASYTYNTQNPVVQLNGYSGSVYVCLTIGGMLCQSTYCDTVYTNNTPQDSCISYFSYQLDPSTNLCNFYDASYTIGGTVTSWSWVITQNGITVFTSNIQNPSFTMADSMIYTVCLTMISSSGCTAVFCEDIYNFDSINNNCQLNVTANITHVSVPNGNDGSIELTVSGGTAPYTFNWYNLGVTGPNAYNLPSGVYTVTVEGSNPVCQAMSYTFSILEPFDSSNYIVDTLYTPVIDTCFGFVPDSFYVASITTQGNIVYVTWVFSSGGVSSTLTVSYTFTNNGSQMIILTIDCNGAKNLATYMSYIYIKQVAGLAENTDNKGFNIYPNPVKDYLNIEFDKQTTSKNIIRIFNDAGQQIFIEQVNENTSNVSINTSNFTSGMYLIKIEDSEGKFITKKLVK